MRLTEFEPHWVVGNWKDNQGVEQFGHGRHGMGLSFVCPIHRNHRLAIMFKNPVDGLPAASAKNYWNRSGDTFDTLTVSPSIDASGGIFGDLHCWHGHIQNGEIK